MQKLLSTRGGTIAIGAVAAVLAAVVFLIYLNRYRDSVGSDSEPVAVLVAKSLIPKGTSGDVIGTRELFESATTPKSQLKDGAIVDPAALKGRIAVTDIYPGQQLAATDFSTEAAGALGLQLTEDQRAINVPLDSAHGLIGQIQAGDHVDVLAGFSIVPVDENGVPVDQAGQARPVLKAIMQDILVVTSPVGEKTGIAQPASGVQNLTLRVTPEQANQLAFASDNGKVWFVLRPRSGAPQEQLDIVTIETLILGIKPIAVYKSFVERPGQQP